VGFGLYDRHGVLDYGCGFGYESKNVGVLCPFHGCDFGSGSGSGCVHDVSHYLAFLCLGLESVSESESVFPNLNDFWIWICF
jgi:hypothetical protein